MPPYLPDHADVRRELAEYYQSVSRLDQGIGMVLDALQEAGLDDNTMVIYLSDNGIAFPGTKTTLYDPGLRIPLLVSTPALHHPGMTNHAMISWVDITPTILDWTETPGPKNYALQGRSFLPVLEQEHPAGWNTIFASSTFHEVTMYYPVRVIQEGSLKLIRNLFHQLPFPATDDLYHSLTWQGILRRGDTTMGVRSLQSYVHRPLEELYDLGRDSNEIRNLVEDPHYKDRLNDLRSRLKTWQEQTKDPWAVAWHFE